MAISYVRAANPIWIFRDLVGQPLNDEYYISFLSNVFPYLPLLVYRDNQGVVPWSDPLQLTTYGGLPENVYFQEDADIVYRLEIRHGPLQSDQLLYVVNDFVPSDGGGSNVSETGSEGNQISNGQFSKINFGVSGTVSPASTTPTLTITTAGTYNIAPGWFLTLTGAGTASVSQIISTGTQDTPANPVPPYYLEISTSGWTTAILYQRLTGNGALWANEYVAMSILARSNDGVARPISLVYKPNSPGTQLPITDATLTVGIFSVVQGVIAVGESTNTGLSDASYIDMQIVLPGTGIVDISNVQVQGQVTSALPEEFTVLATETIERQTDHLFHIYADELIIKPKDSLLTGWNFRLSPSQIIDTTALTTITNQVQYITDQTILRQEAASQLAVTINNSSYINGLAIKAVAAATTTRFALIQYVDPSIAAAYWNVIVSSLVKGRIGTSHGTQVRIKMRLIYRNGLPPTISSTEPIASWAANADPVFSAGWTAIAPLNDPAYILPNAQDAQGEYPAFPFDAFQLPSIISSFNQTLGIVFYTMDNLNSTATTDLVALGSISLVPNLFAVETNPITFDENLRQCQFYYEKSYNPGVAVGTVTAVGQVWKCFPIVMTGTAATPDAAVATSSDIYLRSFQIDFKEVKRAAPAMVFWSPDGTLDRLKIGINTGTAYNAITGLGGVNPNNIAFAANWTVQATSVSRINYVPNTTTRQAYLNTPALAAECSVLFHYSADARLGV